MAASVRQPRILPKEPTQKFGNVFELDYEAFQRLKREFPENRRQGSKAGHTKDQGARSLLETTLNSRLSAAVRHATAPAASVEKARSAKHGLPLGEFMKKLEAVVALTPAKARELQLSLDHVQPDIITWNEFVEWFQLQVEVRDQVHNAQLF